MKIIKNLRNPCKNYENNENLRLAQKIMKITRILEFHRKSRNHENLNMTYENHENQTKKL